MILFEIYLSPGADASQLLSAEVREESGAQLFSEAEAALVGLEGIPARGAEGERLFIACRPSDERLIHSRLEASAAVAAFRMHTL